MCKACYGTLYNVNYGMHAGLYSAISLSEDASQVQLSAKHALNTSSTRVEIIDEHMFLIAKTSWLFTLNDIIDRSKYELVFIANDVNMIKKEEYGKYDNYYIHRLVFRNIHTKEIFEVYEKSDCSLYLSNQLFRLLDKSGYFLLKNKSDEEITISLLDIDINDPFVFLRISNKELAAPIKKLKKFIQSGKKPLENVKNYHEFIDTVSDLYRTGGIDIPSVHVEMLLRNLIRNVDDLQELPDWSIPQTPDMYTLLSLNSSIINNASAICSLLFERQKQQLRGTSIYRKSKSSIHSLLFYNE